MVIQKVGIEVGQKRIGREKEYVGLPVVGRGRERELGTVDR